MSQRISEYTKTSRMSKENQYDRKKRKHSDLVDSDEEILTKDDFQRNKNLNGDKYLMKRPKLDYLSKNNLKAIRNERMLSKQKVDMPECLSQENFNMIHEVHQRNNKDPNEGSLTKAPIKDYKVCISENFTLINKSEADLNGSANKNSSEDFCDYLSLFTGCKFKVINDSIETYKLEVQLNKQNEEMLFHLEFKKQEDTDYVDYIPIKVDFELKDAAAVLLEELEIHKDDLPKLLNRLLIYKFN